MTCSAKLGSLKCSRHVEKEVSDYVLDKIISIR